MREQHQDRADIFWSGPALLILGMMVGVCASGSAVEASARHAVRRLPEQVLVVINADSPVSREVGRDYAAKRAVPTVVEVHCPDSAVATANETMTFAAYQELIEGPVARVLATHPGIDFIVLTKGIPIRVTGGRIGNTVGDGKLRGTAVPSLDSTLAALGYEAATASRYTFAAANTGGATGVAWENRYWNADEPFSHAKFGGYLVSRLDGYTREDALSLVARALAAERDPPRGAVLLDVQPEFGIGAEDSHPEALPDHAITRETPWSIFNTDMSLAASRLKARKVAVELDLTPVFLGDRADLAGYYSWGSNDAHFKAEAYASLRFAPGSIGDTAVSTSARTFLPTKGGQTLMADLIAHGLTASKGYCNEPLLQAISSPSITLLRYASGFTMAESFAMGSHFVGWEDVVIGDPLCAPFAPRP